MSYAYTVDIDNHCRADFCDFFFVGSAMALFSLSDDIGKGLGPPLVGILIINFGRRMAFSIAACMWFFSGLLLLALSRTIVADEQDVALQVCVCCSVHCSVHCSVCC